MTYQSHICHFEIIVGGPPASSVVSHYRHKWNIRIYSLDRDIVNFFQVILDVQPGHSVSEGEKKVIEVTSNDLKKKTLHVPMMDELFMSEE